ncbi:MAG: YceI family protein [Lunatimonas sp.]|uniref:YceI family protein n=1 Tax=Lunatimonas sp. TaxID=2060141 RepID=UPI00263B3D25|nr:YceI family protein [Lunatimonas sp.]MCC5938940.1 YceI family protein [Lunatimonas sp.]
MRRGVFFLLIGLGLSYMGWSQSIQPEQPIRFQIKNAGITVEGTFSDWAVEVDFDPKKLKHSSIRGTANPTSIDTGIKLRDKHLLGRQYFNTGSFPEIRLESKAFRATGKNAFIGVFDLTIRDISRELEIPFTVIQAGSKRRFAGEFVIDRLDFGLGEKSLVLSDEVIVKVDF